MSNRPPPSRVHTRFYEALLIVVAIAIGYLASEIGYRAYLYYTYAVQADYQVASVDVPQYAPASFATPGDIHGPSPSNTTYTFSLYKPNDQIALRHKVHTNNLGWISQYDYHREKAPGEFRIAIVGDSLTASRLNEHPWPDILQRNLNADKDLLQRLGIQSISVLNLGVDGASMQFMANPLALIARRFAADMIIVNFIIEDLPRRHAANFEAVPEEPAVHPSDEPDTSSATHAPDLIVDGVGLSFFSCNPPSLSNADCQISPLWYVPPGKEIAGAELKIIKQVIARKLLAHRVLLSARPLLLMRVLGRAAIQGAHAMELVPTPGLGGQQEDIDIALRAFRMISGLSDWKVLITHNPLYWHLTRSSRPAVLDRLLALALDAGYDVVQMEDYMPLQGGEPEWRKWYNVPADGHWSDYGAEIYARAMYRVVSDRLLAAHGISSTEKNACGASYALFRTARTEAESGHADAAKKLDDAIAALPADAADQARHSGIFEDCGFAADLYAERAISLGKGGDQNGESTAWAKAFEVASDPYGLWDRKALADQARGDNKTAAEDFSRMIQLRPDEFAPRLSRARLLQASGDATAALADYQAISRLNVQDGNLRFQLSQARYFLKDYEGAAFDATEGLKLIPNNAGLLLLRGSAEENLGQLDAALTDLTVAINIQPDANLYYTRASILERLGRTKEAEKDRKTARTFK